MGEQTGGFVNGDISERKRGVGWGVDEVCRHTARTVKNVGVYSVYSVGWKQMRCVQGVRFQWTVS